MSLNLLFILFLMALPAGVKAQALSATEIVARADARMRGKSSYAEMTMRIVRPTYERSISMRSWSMGDRYALIKITAPAKDKGSGYVKREKEMWNWLPSIDRMIKMSASVMGQSWMGSDFTNDDMVRESSIVKDYTHRIVGEEEVRGFNCHKIELIPHEEAAVVWGKVLVWIDKKGYHTIRSESYDEELVLSQTLENYDFKEFSGRLMPSRAEMIPEGKKGQKTVVIITNASYDLPMKETFFSQQNLKTMR